MMGSKIKLSPPGKRKKNRSDLRLPLFSYMYMVTRLQVVETLNNNNDYS